MPRIFLSHESFAKQSAVELQEILRDVAPELGVFLTSDWYSLESGRPWFEPLVEELRNCDHLLTLITRKEAFQNPWINFEIGVVFGCRKPLAVLVYGGVGWEHIPYPLRGLQLTDTGDTNRWVNDLLKIGVTKVREEAIRARFAKAFGQQAESA